MLASFITGIILCSIGLALYYLSAKLFIKTIMDEH